MNELADLLQNTFRTYQAGDTVAAEISIRNALVKWPNNPDVLRLGALTALGVNFVTVAEQRLSAAEKLAPMTAEMANTRGNILKVSGDWAGAERAYNLAERLDPNYDVVSQNRLDLFIQSEQPGRILELLDSDDKLEEIKPYSKGLALISLGRFEAALSSLESDRSNRFDDEIILAKIKCYAALGQLEQMESLLRDLPRDSSFAAEALGVVANAFEMRGLRKKALDVISDITSEVNIEVPVMMQAVRLLRRAESPKLADMIFKTVSANNPSDVDFILEKANVALSEGDAKASLEHCKMALQLQPGNFQALIGYAQSALICGANEDALSALQGALMQAPNNQFLLALMATLLRQMGQDHKVLYDYNNFVRVYDIAPPKGYETRLDFNLALKEKLNSLHVYSNAPINQSLRHGTQTEVDLSFIEDPVLEDFFTAIDSSIRDYIKTIGYAPEHPLLRRNLGDYRIQGAWSVRLKENGHHVNHVHPRGWISSAYYVDLPKYMNATDQQGWIKFGEPNLKINQAAEHYVQPKVGRLVLFPSYMWHGTVPFTGPETRMTLPFDVVPA